MVMILSLPIYRKLRGSLMNSMSQVAPYPLQTSIYMSLRVSAVTFLILLQVCQQKLTLCCILSSIAIYPLMNFDIEVHFNTISWLHRC
jgi:hypothetical protein